MQPVVLSFVLSISMLMLSQAEIPPLIKLNNDIMMPRLAFAANVWDANTCGHATSSALSAGFRFVWSSMLIGSDCQAAQAKAIVSSGVAREDLFIAGTVNTGDCSDEEDCYAATKNAAMGQFKVLNSSMLDMLMLDYPSSTPGCEGVNGQWKAFTELYHQKKLRSIAVSNFAVDQLKCVTNSSVVPSVNQLQYSVGHGHDTIVQDNGEYGVVVQAYSPLGSGSLAGDTMLKQIGSSHNKSAAQVALRWILQHNATIATQSTNPEYLQQDADIYGFTLSDSEMKQLDNHP